MKNHSAAVVFALFLMVSCPGAAEENWSGWRGARGDGISRHREVPLSWTPSENIAWKTPLAGAGRSSPIIWGRRVFLTTSLPTDHTRHVLCLDIATGQVMWDTVVHRGAEGKMHKFNTPASSTPTTDGERVYAIFIDEQGMQVVATDVQGRIVWSKRPGTFYSQHGFAASPVLYRDGLVVNGHQDGEAFVVMLDARTGEERWRYKPAINLRSFSTPVLTQQDGRDLLILTGASQTAALDPLDGQLIWHVQGPSEKFVCTPSVGHGMVFSFGGSPEKIAMAIRLGGSGNVAASHVAWRIERGMPYVPTPLLYGDLLHIVNDLGIYTCLEPATGKTLFSKRAFGPMYSSPIAVEERIYFFEDTGRCTVVRNGRDLDVLATNELGAEVYTTPAVADGCLIVRTVSHVVRIGTRNAAANEPQ
ncbi:MAG: PQQ-binding-like beta-propeller repeat protein [Pirellulaceae bacterium]